MMKSKSSPKNRRPAAVGFGVLILAIISTTLLAPASIGQEEDDLRARLENLSVTEKEELRRKREAFGQLDEDRQQRMRKMHEQIAASPDRARLEELLLQYHEWLKSLTQEERAKFLQLPEDEKIAEIKRHMQQQRQKQFAELVNTKLPPEDVRSIFVWLDYYAASHEQELLTILPDPMRERIEKSDMPDSMRRRALLMALGYRKEGTPLPAPTEEDLAKLTENLTPTALSALAAVPDPDKKLELVRGWVRAAVAARFTPQVSEERLLKYYRENRDRMDPAKREELESLPREEFYNRMRQVYVPDRGSWRGRHWDGRNRGDGSHHGGDRSRDGGDRSRDDGGRSQRDGDRRPSQGERDRGPAPKGDSPSAPQ